MTVRADELEVGLRVLTPRGYGVVVSVIRYRKFPGRALTGFDVLVELDTGGRPSFRPDELTVAAVDDAGEAA